MLTERERIARELARDDRQYGAYPWEMIPRKVQERFQQGADYILHQQGVVQAHKDKEAAKTWGGDIDLVSFEGE